MSASSSARQVLSAFRTTRSHCMCQRVSISSNMPRNTILLRPLSQVSNCSIRSFHNSTPNRSSTPLGTVGSGASGAQESTDAAASSLLTPGDHMSEAEIKIWEKLNGALQPTKLEVQDISGGCGSMYGIEVESEKFRGLNMLKQQRMVNGILAEEVKGWHGIQLKTKAP